MYSPDSHSPFMATVRGLFIPGTCITAVVECGEQAIRYIFFTPSIRYIRAPAVNPFVKSRVIYFRRSTVMASLSGTWLLHSANVL